MQARMLMLAVYITACLGARFTTTSMPAPAASTSTPPPSTAARTTLVFDDLPSAMPSVCTDANSIHSPLARLRSAMRNKGYTQMNAFFDAFIIFFSDEHLSEEPSKEERRLEYFSGWDGAGTGVVMGDGGAALWVTSGEVQRARASVSCAWDVIDSDNLSQPIIPEWISDKIGRTGRVGADARLTSVNEWQLLSSHLQQMGLTLIHTPTLLDQLWNEELDPDRRRPDFSKIVANLHVMEYTGMTWRDKVTKVREELQTMGADAMVVTALDEVAWLLNVRGKDLPYSPLLKAFVVISTKEVRVYAPPGKLSMPVREVLAVYNCFTNNCTRVQEYTNIYADLRRATESKILIPTAGTFHRGASAAIAQSVPQAKRLYLMSPIIYLKAQKNEAERKGMKKAHLRDAVAMCTVLSYLEQRRTNAYTEITVAKMVDMTRETQAGFVSASMKTLVAFGPNGADPYYVPTVASARRIFTNSTMVIRSGGQYDEGTTVITRTVHYGRPTKDDRRAYTTVLRSIAALSTLQWPSALPAAHLDPVARAPLWAANQDYSHPTGHGVGAALNRLEDPVVIDYRQDVNLHTLREGYYITTEPAWYDTGRFGVRLGNVLEVVTKPHGYFRFREATLVPFEPNLIDKAMLTDYEINWLNDYNSRIRSTVGPELKEQGLFDVFYWMSNKTAPYTLPSKQKMALRGAGYSNQANLLSLVTLFLAFLLA
ncbi:xaa-Pro aminopeptidase 1 isoform X2 [Plodia interpunctella]|uniref:xaa-Pro aminopeptidase 1 isoform X2 n=1 Tax=Plodia interpunctella TaxID=58824 RepID=UPI002368C195|nr:xaa-Pro aminopeptidase 1 isoform X2 [Plodia interpunctella]